MSDIEKAKEALSNLLWLIDQGQLIESEPSVCGPTLVYEAREALAALEEKTSDDVLSEWVLEHTESFAASYHARECAKCSKLGGRA